MHCHGNWFSVASSPPTILTVACPQPEVFVNLLPGGTNGGLAVVDVVVVVNVYAGGTY